MAGATAVDAQQHAHGDGGNQYQVEPSRVDRGPVVDGLLDEVEWQGAAMIDRFTQQEPAEGEPATERTEVLLLYDATRLYIGVRAFDSNANGIVATEMRRDSDRLLEEDNFQIILDTFRDSRNGYMFVTSPLGAKLEQQVFEEAEGGDRSGTSNINRNWDGVWHAEARRSAEGWTAEIAIPMATLRFPRGNPQTWGVNFMRSIRRKNEQVFWAPIPKAYGLTRVSLAGSMAAMDALSQGLDLRIKPFVVAGGQRDRTGVRIAQSGLNDVGLDVKYGIRSGLNLDLTLNTDFAQAEVDEQQINLTRFPLFFPEKRDFFLENAGQFNVGTTAASDRMTDLFFSRRIGLSDAGQPIPILGGARLTGKVDRHNLAIMNIQTNDALGAPGENVFAARYSRDVLRRSKIGALVVDKEVVGDARFNRTFAADTTLAVGPSFTINSFLASTSTPGISEGDVAFHGRAGWLDRRWDVYAEYTDIQDNFNPEIGFVPRRGIRTSKLHVERTPRPGGTHIRVLNPMVNITYTTDQNNRLLTRRVHHMLGIRLQNGGWVNLFYNRHLDHLDVPFAIRRNVTIPAGTYRFGEWNVTYNSDPSRRLYQEFTFRPQTFYGGTRMDLNSAIGARVTNQFAALLKYQRNDVDLPWGRFVANLGMLRLDLALSPRMTFRTLSQFNSSTQQFSNSIRLNFIYRPGSDIYVTYDELKGDLPGVPEVRNRRLIVKMTYLLAR